MLRPPRSFFDDVAADTVAGAAAAQRLPRIAIGKIDAATCRFDAGLRLRRSGIDRAEGGVQRLAAAGGVASALASAATPALAWPMRWARRWRGQRFARGAPTKIAG
jgi:hypothetical protein